MGGFDGRIRKAIESLKIKKRKLKIARCRFSGTVLLILLSALPVLAQTLSDEVRVDPVRRRGAIAAGLRWLGEHQVRSGAEAGAWQARTANYRPAIASLAGLAFLANGHLPGDDGPYGETLSVTLKYVMGAMAPDGYLGQGDRSGMYIHAISSLFAFSCLGMQAEEAREPELAEWCRRSLDVIVGAQQISKSDLARGGWRYDPYISESDVSVTCWQMLVLHTARQAGFEVDDSVFRAAQAYLNRAFQVIEAAPDGDSETSGGYLYRPGFSQEPEPSATALVMYIQTLFDAADDARTQQAMAYLRRYPPAWDGEHYGGFFYFASFYMMQGMFQVGGEAWDWFGPRMALVLLDHQSGDGSWPYPPNNAKPALLRETGAAYPVAVAVLMLSLEKQYLPMFQRQRRLYDSPKHIVVPDKTAEVEKTQDPVPIKVPEPKQEDPLVIPGSGWTAPEARTEGTGGFPEGGDGGNFEDEANDRPAIGRPMFK